MQVAETHYLDNTFTFNIPPAPYRRRIAVPLIMATALGKDSKASHRLIFNGVSVAYVEANAGRINVVTGVSSFPPSGVMPSYSNFYLPETDCDSWFGVIEAIRFPLVPLLNTPLEYRGIYQLTTYYGRLGQVEAPYANTVSYLDVPAT